MCDETVVTGNSFWSTLEITWPAFVMFRIVI